MISAGIDIGSRTTKAVLLQDHRIVAKQILSEPLSPQEAAESILNLLLCEAKISRDSLKSICTTGYGRSTVSCSLFNVSEISCHAKGVSWLDKSIRTVIDIGGQDCKVILIDERGSVRDFRMNTKCAAGTGVSIENLAKTLEMTVEKLSSITVRRRKALPITSKCTIYMELEVLSWLFQGKKIRHIARGIITAVATQIAQLANSMHLEPPVAITGGVAKNTAVINELARQLNLTFTSLPFDPQFLGAIGAALFAEEGKGIS